MTLSLFIHNLKICHEFKPYTVEKTQRDMITSDGLFAFGGVFYQKKYVLPGLQNEVYIECRITQSTQSENRIGISFQMQINTEAGTTNLETFFNYQAGTDSNLDKISVVKIVEQFLAIARGCALYLK